MEELPHIPLVDSTNKFYNVVYEEDDKRRNYKVLAYLNQTGLIDYTQEKFCKNVFLERSLSSNGSPKLDENLHSTPITSGQPRNTLINTFWM